MEKDLQEKIEAFCSLMRQLGYSGRYTLVNDRGMPLDYPKELKECLQDILSTDDTAKDKRTLRLETKPNHAPYIRCVFTVDFDTGNGFHVRQLFLRDTDTSKEETIRVPNNKHIPSNQAIIARFPRARPWQRHLKGKFGI